MVAMVAHINEFECKKYLFNKQTANILLFGLWLPAH